MSPAPAMTPVRSLLVSAVLVGAGLSVAVPAQAAPAQAAPAEVTFSYTGGEQTYTVPAGVTSVRVTAKGAPGAVGQLGKLGGRGRSVAADVPVTPGQTLYVEVGGAGQGTVGGFNGGGAGGRNTNLSNDGGGGGGASDVRSCPAVGPCGVPTLDSRLLIAAGGGGAGVNAGGDADADGATNIFFDSGGKKASAVFGGAGGAAGSSGGPGAAGGPGVGGVGAPASGGSPGGGGGGGGLNGGGGGGSGGQSGGGGGGASSASGLTNIEFGFDDTRTPSVTITPIVPVTPDPPVTPTVPVMPPVQVTPAPVQRTLTLSDRTIRTGQRFTLKATGLAPGQRYELFVYGEVRYLGHADAKGRVVRSVRYPSKVASKKRTIRLFGYVGERREFTQSVSLRYTRIRHR